MECALMLKFLKDKSIFFTYLNNFLMPVEISSKLYDDEMIFATRENNNLNNSF